MSYPPGYNPAAYMTGPHHVSPPHIPSHHPPPAAYPPPGTPYPGAATVVAPQVRYGVPFVLRHVPTGRVLASRGQNYTTGSRQQEVHCSNNRDHWAWWVFKPAHNNMRHGGMTGQPVLNGQLVRIEHLETGLNLHSHGNIRSPATSQQEATCFVQHAHKGGIGDSNDNWRVEIHQPDPMNPSGLTQATQFRLIHVNTNHAFHSHNGYFSPVTQEQEVTCFSGRDNNDLWQIELIA